MSHRACVFALMLAGLIAGAARAQTPEPALVKEPSRSAALSEETLGGERGGLATPLGFEVGFGASVKTSVDGSLALETRMTWTAAGAQTERVFESEQAKALTGALAGTPSPSGAVQVAPGASVIHDLTNSRIASVLMNTGDNHLIRQDTDITLNLPQLPDLQQRIGAERLGQALQALSPQAAGLAP